jgi:hypothetical protein
MGRFLVVSWLMVTGSAVFEVVCVVKYGFRRRKADLMHQSLFFQFPDVVFQGLVDGFGFAVVFAKLHGGVDELLAELEMCIHGVCSFFDSTYPAGPKRDRAGGEAGPCSGGWESTRPG